MKATRKTTLAVLFLGLSCLTSTGLAGPSDTSCSIMIPASAPIEQTRRSASAFATASKPPSIECPTIAGGRPTALPIHNRLWRSFQNGTPYHVVVYGNGTALGTIAPCSESFLVVPRGELRMKAIAIIPEDNGQREVEVVLGLNDKMTGWQVLDDTSLTLR